VMIRASASKNGQHQANVASKSGPPLWVSAGGRVKPLEKRGFEGDGGDTEKRPAAPAAGEKTDGTVTKKGKRPPKPPPNRGVGGGEKKTHKKQGWGGIPQ